MAGTRVRCVCGTVFDPTKASACPACGTAYEARPAAKPVETDPLPTPPPRREQPVQRDAATGFEPGGSFFEKNKTAVMVAGGVAGFLILALVMRLIAGGSPPDKVSRVDIDSLIKSDDAESPASVTPAPTSPSPSFPPESNPPRETPPSFPRRSEPEPPPMPQSDIPSFYGKWRLAEGHIAPEQITSGMPADKLTIAQMVKTAFAGPDVVAMLAVDKTGAYLIEVSVIGEGTYTADVRSARNLHSVSAQGTLTFSPKDALVPDRARFLLKPVHFDIPHLNVKAGDMQLTLVSDGNTGGANVTWVRSGAQQDDSVAGAWSIEQIFVDSNIPYRTGLELRDDGAYTIHFTRTEQGSLIAAGGDYEFKRSARIGAPMRGTYAFDGLDRVTLTEQRGTTTWQRAEDAGGGRNIRR